MSCSKTTAKVLKKWIDHQHHNTLLSPYLSLYVWKGSFEPLILSDETQKYGRLDHFPNTHTHTPSLANMDMQACVINKQSIFKPT